MGHSKPVLSLYDLPLWESTRAHRMKLQCCLTCETYRYPPAPICHACLSTSTEWREISGNGSILSWVIFHKQYFDDYPVPYNVVSVALEEGPIFTTNLVGSVPNESWLGAKVIVRYRDNGNWTLPVVELA